jgi:hypothetical protein
MSSGGGGPKVKLKRNYVQYKRMHNFTMDRSETRCERVDWTEVVQATIRWRNFVNKTMTLRTVSD